MKITGQRISRTLSLTKDQENMIRVCTRQYIEDTNEYPKAWTERKEAIIDQYKPVSRLVEKYPEQDAIQKIGNIIVDEWRSLEQIS